MGYRLRCCRLCGRYDDAERTFQESKRHYVHYWCYLLFDLPLHHLTTAQLNAFPRELLLRKGVLPLVQKLLKRVLQ